MPFSTNSSNFFGEKEEIECQLKENLLRAIKHE
jgi:hypothetical protein